MEQIERLTSLNATDFEQLKFLMGILSEGFVLTEEAIRSAIQQATVYVVRSAEGRIIGSATLAVFHSPTGKKASIEDVVVDPAHQGRGIGRRLVAHLIDEAKQMSPITLQLTSRPSREAANHLYQTLGFVRRETNFYKMTIG